MQHKKGIATVKPVWVIIICIVSLTPGVSFSPSIKEIFFATWNVENLFDDEPALTLRSDDPISHNNQQMTWWNTALYQKKCARLAEIITQMNSGKGPDILALVEVENARVIADLVGKLPNPQSYTIVHIEGEASRGMEVGVISRFPVLAQSSHFVWHGVRDILQVDIDVYGHRLTVLVNHWKSRVGGTFETADLRTLCAARAYQIYREIVRENESADVILCGDFNDTPQTLSITEVLNAKASVEKIQRQRERKYLYNCTTELEGKSVGTHCYDSEWNFLDQIIISKWLLDDVGLRYQKNSIAVFNPKGVLIREGEPWRFGGKNEKHRGYSDHLPLVARFGVDGR